MVLGSSSNLQINLWMWHHVTYDSPGVILVMRLGFYSLSLVRTGVEPRPPPHTKFLKKRKATSPVLQHPTHFQTDRGPTRSSSRVGHCLFMSSLSRHTEQNHFFPFKRNESLCSLDLPLLKIGQEPLNKGNPTFTLFDRTKQLSISVTGDQLVVFRSCE